MTLPIVIVGADNDELQFETPSWSRPFRKIVNQSTGEIREEDIIHSLTISKRDGVLRCSCEDWSCRRRQERPNLLDDPLTEGCKHIRKLWESCERIRREGIEVAIAA